MSLTVPDQAMLLRLQQIEQEDFGSQPWLSADEQTERLPVVKANLRRHTRMFNEGQKVYIYNVYWGLNERAMVVARFRRKYQFVFGVVPIKDLSHFRPDHLYHPKALEKFRQTAAQIHTGIFRRFFERPDLPAPPLRQLPQLVDIRQLNWRQRVRLWFLGLW